MGNWPDYAPGESVQHSARRENEINAILKAGDLFKDGRILARSPQSVRVQAYNATNATIQPGQAAQIDVTGAMCNEAFPVVPFSDPDAPFGVFTEAVEPNAGAAFILTGPAAVKITGSTGSYAMPTEEGVFERGDEGVRILHLSGGTAGIVLLGHYHGGTIYDEGIGIVIDGGTEGQNYTINTNITGDGENIVVTGGSAGNPLVITYTGSGGGGGGIGFPDYVALAGGTFSNALGEITDEDYDGTLPPPATIPDDQVLGITYVMPVPAGEPIKYYASADCLVRFAPFYEAGGEHYYYDLSESMEWTPNTGGHLRISILDDGSHSGDCIRIYVAGVDWSDALPIYKCAKFGPRGATGINSSVSGGTAFITLSGATGSVRFVGDGTVEIEGNTNNEIVLSATGGGGGFIPNWRHGGHSGVIPPDNGSNIPYTAAEEGYIFAWASFDPFKDGLRYRNYAAHVSINGGLMKVAELKLPGESAYIKANSTSFERDTTKDYSNKIRVEVYDENAGEWVKKVYTRDYSDDYYDSDEDEYTYFAWYCYNAPEDYKTLYSDEWNIRGGESVYTKDDSGEETVFSYLTDCEFYPEYYLFAWVNGNTTVYTYSGSITAGNTSVYMPNERGEFQSVYTITETNADNFVVAIGAGLPIPYRKGASIRFIVTADGYPYGTLVNYANPGSPPAVCCLVYEKPAPQDNNES